MSGSPSSNPPLCHSPYVMHYSMHIMHTYATPTQGKHTGEDKTTHERGDATPLSVLCLLDGGSAATCSAYNWWAGLQLVYNISHFVNHKYCVLIPRMTCVWLCVCFRLQRRHSKICRIAEGLYESPQLQANPAYDSSSVHEENKQEPTYYETWMK